MSEQWEFIERNPLGRSPCRNGVPGHAQGSDTSKAAAGAVQKDLVKSQRRVLLALDYLKRATADSLTRFLQLGHNSVAPRLTELKKMGYVFDTGERKPTASGQTGAVLALTNKGSVYVERNR